LPIRNQEQCGSCWAFSAAEVLGDRFSIAKVCSVGDACAQTRLLCVQGTAGSPVLSSQDLVSCDSGDMGCSGGMLPSAWAYLQGNGRCLAPGRYRLLSHRLRYCHQPMLSLLERDGHSAPLPEQVHRKRNGSMGSAETFRFLLCSLSASLSLVPTASSGYPIDGVANMQKEIMTNGPIQVAFYVYESFMSYKSGVCKWPFSLFPCLLPRFSASASRREAVVRVGPSGRPCCQDHWLGCGRRH
jgi:cathepsin B